METATQYTSQHTRSGAVAQHVECSSRRYKAAITSDVDAHANFALYAYKNGTTRIITACKKLKWSILMWMRSNASC